jgi:hypothetical protein
VATAVTRRLGADTGATKSDLLDAVYLHRSRSYRCRFWGCWRRCRNLSPDGEASSGRTAVTVHGSRDRKDLAELTTMLPVGLPAIAPFEHWRTVLADKPSVPTLYKRPSRPLYRDAGDALAPGFGATRAAGMSR